VVAVLGVREEVGSGAERRFQKKRSGGFGKKELMGGPRQSEREREGLWGFPSRAGLLGRWLRAGPVGLVSLFFCSASFSYFLFSALLFEKVKPI
jgi:hypothetical protein